MKNNINENQVVEGVNSTVDSTGFETTWTHQEYHEMADVPVVQNDVISQFQLNLAQLEDLQRRLSFVMREVRYTLKA